MVATIAGLMAILYVTVAGPQGPNSQGSPLTVSVARVGTNWTVTFTGVSGGPLPSELHLLLRNSAQDIVLPRTPFASLTAANWSLYRVLYVDGHPGDAEVRPGDGLRIDLGRFPAGSVLEASDRSALLLVQPLA